MTRIDPNTVGLSDTGFGLDDYYPDFRQFVTILRDPLDMHVSRYFFTRARVAKNAPIFNDIGTDSLTEFILNGRLNMLEHFPEEITASNYRDVLEERFVDIGLFENLSASLKRIAARLGQDPAPVDALEHKNAAARDAPFPYELRDRFRERWPLEHEIYRYAVERQAER